MVDSAGKEYIIEVNDCAMGLMGEGQDDDRKNIADLVISEMEVRQKYTFFIYITNTKFSPGASHQSRRSRRRPPQRRGAADPSPSSVMPRSGRGGKTARQKAG